MKQINTEITIQAPAHVVWNVLTNFDLYPQWNPFILSFDGIPAKGSRFSVTIQQPGSKAMTFKPLCLEFEENRLFRWLGHLGIKGIFDGEHSFELVSVSEYSTRFIHSETFSGILVPLLWKQLNTKTRQGFTLMNEALKSRAENQFVKNGNHTSITT